jgi:putative tryptophan/tyrosine transport system substrate-binding protein
MPVTIGRRELLAALGGAAAWPNSVAAQPRARRALVAMLVAGTSVGYSGLVQAFRRGLQKFGYIEGRDFDIVDRYADGDPTRLPALAMELVKLKPDVIVTTSTSSALAAKQATTAVPITSAILTDPIGKGLAASEARPGGNVTGIEFTLRGLTGKQLELAREVIPQTSSVGLLVNMKNASNPPQRRDVEAAANASSIRLVPVDVGLADQLGAAFQAYARERVDWVVVLGDSLFVSNRDQIAALAISLRLPTIFAQREHVLAGGLMSYGIDIAANFERVAYYVDKILKGAKAGDLPIEFPTKVVLSINLTPGGRLCRPHSQGRKAIRPTSRAGLEVPPTLLARADEVIE